jgi:hypothetical protein
VSVSHEKLSVPTPEHGSPEDGEPARVEAGYSLHARTGTTSALSEHEPMAASAPGSVGAKAPVVAQPRQRSVHVASSNEKPEAVEAAQASVPLGPNRSPIIE